MQTKMPKRENKIGKGFTRPAVQKAFARPASLRVLFFNRAECWRSCSAMVAIGAEIERVEA